MYLFPLQMEAGEGATTAINQLEQEKVNAHIIYNPSSMLREVVSFHATDPCVCINFREHCRRSWRVLI